MPPKKATLDEVEDLLDEKLATKVGDLLDEKLATLKSDIVLEVKNSIVQIFADKLKEKDKQIVKLESTVAMLQMHVSNLKHANEKKLEELEQYGRRLCLRLDGVPHKEVESSYEVLNTVKEKIKEVGADIPDVVIDRAHRIGMPYVDDQSRVKTQSIIVRFTTFRHRTMFYNKRKLLKGNIRVKLDLTKERYGLLKSARERVSNLENVKYVYVDLNCRLKIRMQDDKEFFFNSIDDLVDKVDPVYPY